MNFVMKQAVQENLWCDEFLIHSIHSWEFPGKSVKLALSIDQVCDVVAC
jgi:hypothetical protein